MRSAAAPKELGSTLSINVVSPVPTRPLPVAAESGCFFFHLPLQQPSSHVYGSAQVDANTNCSELATRQPLLKTDPNFENLQTVSSQAKNIRLQSSRFSFDFKHSSHMKNMRKLRFKIPSNILKCHSFCFEVTTVSIQVITLVSKLRKFSFESRPRNHILIVLSWAGNV